MPGRSVADTWTVKAKPCRTLTFPWTPFPRTNAGQHATLAAENTSRCRLPCPTPTPPQFFICNFSGAKPLVLALCLAGVSTRNNSLTGTLTLSQVKSLMARAEELQRKLEEAGESNRIITQAVRLKQDELDQLSVINSAINRQLKVSREGTGAGGEDRKRWDAVKGRV